MTSKILTRQELQTPSGAIRYWLSPRVEGEANLVFLPGLTADHRLFDKQIEYFSGRANCLVWDAPSHGESRPFELSWSLDDLARWLREIIERESFARPVIVGQSMGGYLAQAYMELFPADVSAFVSVDSAPLNHQYFKGWELRLLRHTHAMYSAIPWKLLLKWGSNGCSTTEYGRSLMREMMEGYAKREYVDLAAHGYRILADAVETGREYAIDCPAVIVCGTKDMAGSCKRYDQEWAKRTELPLVWIDGAGHNANCDAPDAVNEIIATTIKDS